MSVLSLKLTFDGRPFDPEHFRNVLRRAVINRLKDQVVKKLENGLTAEELSQTTINFTERDGKTLFEVQSPGEIPDLAKKIEKIMRS